jgi:hypothetical protein
MVCITPLPTYSTERYYMLSEIELNGHSTFFLCDYGPEQSSNTVPAIDLSEEGACPSHLVLYVLWTPDMALSPQALVDGVIRDSLNMLKSLTGSQNPKIYLVVDSLTTDTDPKDKSTRQNLYDSQVCIAGDLARCVEQSKELRDELQGVTIGVSNHMRAAPGLEKCMEAMCCGSKDRRKAKGSKGCIGIVSPSPDDLIGLQYTEPDAAQGVLQSITCAEWNGNGDSASFSERAHTVWCANNETELQREHQHGAESRQRLDGIVADPGTITLFVCVSLWFFFHLLTSSGDSLQNTLAWQ